ncbi:MAG: LPS export ABC transporter periplasmic protein LptC [Treponema sp.]|nr:LPS export ABC transporter periplasmic protein LptC [Treponema sp.]
MKKIVKSCVYSILLLFILNSCTFDYGDLDSSGRELPDLIMENVEYVRVRSADPVARIQAERAERYEQKGLMKLENFSFEQYGDHGRSVNVYGRAGHAEVEVNSGDILMDSGVWLDVESEDIMLETNQINWVDEQRLISSGEGEIVNIYQQNGTSFTGEGLRADARRRTWEFFSSVSGSYVEDDD